MKKNLILIGIITSTIVLAVLSVVTAMKIRELGTQPVAPSVPKTKPKAVEPEIPEIPPSSEACKQTFLVALVATPTPGPSPTPTATGTPGPSPTPTSTPTPGPTVTGTPGPTSTPVPGESYCDYLTADKTAGLIPLTVTFKGKGVDTTRVKGFRFTFGDGEKKEFLGSFTSDQVQAVSHTYSKVGAYTAILEILDDGDHWRTRDNCRLIVSAGVEEALAPTSTPKPGVTTVPSAATPTEVQLPAAGLKLPTLGGIIAGFLLISLGAALIF